MKKKNLISWEDPRWGVVHAVTDSYTQNGALAVMLVLADGEPLTDLSKNLPGSSMLPPGHFYAKTYSENEEIAKYALKSGWFEEVGPGVESGFVRLPVWRLLDKRKEAV